MRKHYLDNIRIITVLFVVLYHIFYMFNGVGVQGVVGPVTSFHGQDVILYLLYPWFMVILFIVSGMSARYYLEHHTAKEFMKARTRKLLVPSTIGLFVFGWVQGYFNMAIGHAFDTMPDTPAFILFPIMVVSGTGVLWTIQVLWICSVLLLLLRKIEQDRLYQLGEKVGIVALVLLGILAWGAAQILNTPVIAVYRFGIYIFAFMLGYYVFSHEKVTDTLAKHCVWLIPVSVVLGVAYTYFYFGENFAIEPYVNAPLAIAFSWMACLAIIGGMKKWGNKSSKFTQFMNKKSFGLYVFHYLGLSVAAYGLVDQLHMDGILVYIISALASVAGGFLLFEIFSRIPVLRWCLLGMKKEKKCDGK